MPKGQHKSPSDKKARGNAGGGVSQTQQPPPTSKPEIGHRHVGGQYAGRAVYPASLPGPLWTAGDKEAENVPTGKQLAKPMLSSDMLIGRGEDLGANACEAHNLRTCHFMRPIRKALATA